MVSEAKTEITCLQRKYGGKVPFTVTGAGQVHKQTPEFVNLGGAISAYWTRRSVDVTRRLQRAWAFFERHNIEIYDSLGLRLRLKGCADVGGRGDRNVALRFRYLEPEKN